MAGKGMGEGYLAISDEYFSRCIMTSAMLIIYISSKLAFPIQYVLFSSITYQLIVT